MKSSGNAILGRDAEVRYTQDGKAVANLSLAVKYGVRGQDGKYPTQWIDASLWGKQAEALAPYLLKGTQHCFHLDSMHLENFKRSDNTQGVKMVARVVDVELGRNGDTQAASPAAAPAPQPPRRAAPSPAPRQGGSSGFDDMDDDIPFRDPLAQRGFHLAIA